MKSEDGYFVRLEGGGEWKIDELSEEKSFEFDDFQRRYLGKWFWNERMRDIFDESEAKMVRKMADKFHYPQKDIVRMAVREMFVRDFEREEAD